MDFPSDSATRSARFWTSTASRTTFLNFYFGKDQFTLHWYAVRLLSASHGSNLTHPQYFCTGVVLYVLTERFNVSLFTLIGALLLAQLLAFRIALSLQKKGILVSAEIDLLDSFVFTPSSESVQTVVLVCGEMLRNGEETVKDLSLTEDYSSLSIAVACLVFLSALGRIATTPTVLFGLFCFVFGFPLVYTKNRQAVDDVVNTSLDAANLFVAQAVEKTKKKGGKAE